SRPCRTSSASRGSVAPLPFDHPADGLLEAGQVAVGPDAPLLLVGDGPHDDTGGAEDGAGICGLDRVRGVHDRAGVQAAAYRDAPGRVPLEHRAVEVAGALSPVLVLQPADPRLEDDALHAPLAVRVREPL